MRRASSLLISLGLLATLFVAGRQFDPTEGERSSAQVESGSAGQVGKTAGASRGDASESGAAPQADDTTGRDDARDRAAVLGTWEDDYQGKRTMTLKEDGTGTMIVELTGMSATLFAARLEFDMVWSVEDGRLKKQTVGGRPEKRVAMILQMMGDRVDEPILELTAERLVLLDQDGETRYEWRRKSKPTVQFRGVFFNPNVRHEAMAGYPWPVFTHYTGEYRRQIQEALSDLKQTAHINLVAVFVPIPFTLATPPHAPTAGQSLAEWANVNYLDGLALFVDDCHAAELGVELDLADNRWIPYSVDSAKHIGQPGNPSWPVADETPWEESATWYSQVIEYVEAQAEHPESIAMWGMLGHYQHGTAEPCLWNTDATPEILSSTREFVKHVWPAFRSAGKRPKAAPILLPIFSSSSYWQPRSAEERLSAVRNLKQWIVDDLALPPDYWLITGYPSCDPAPDGVYYLRRIVELLGPESASRLIVTDLKGPGHEHELSDTMLSVGNLSGRDMLDWHMRKCAEYGLAGWWIYSYQDQESLDQRTGIRNLDGTWKTDLLQLVRQQQGE
jgi:hypothetical protein